MNTHHPVLPGRPRRSMLAVLACAAVLLAVALPAVAFAATFDPLNVIPYETYRGSSSMSAADIQAFLATQPGPLKSLKTTDYVNASSGLKVKGQAKKSAARIIYEAAQRWNLNPKVILATLQKEESLITVSNSINAARYKKAMGCGVYGDANHDGKTDNRYPGFGSQVWNGARVLSTYEITYKWKPGAKRTVTAYKSVTATKTVDGSVVSYKKKVSYNKTIVPKNASTFALYIYTPYYPQSLVWNTYVRFFGDPATPPRMRPVYRFRKKSNGTYYYTSSEAKRYTLVRKSKKTWSFQGTAFRQDASATVNVVPLYELYNTKTHTYAYTSWASSRDKLLAKRPKQWRYDHVVAYVSHDSSGTLPVYRLVNKASHQSYYTSSASVKKSFTTGKKAKYAFASIPFYLARSADATPAIGPVN